MAGHQAGLKEQHETVVQQGSEENVLKKTESLQHQQKALVDVLSVCGHQPDFVQERLIEKSAAQQNHMKTFIADIFILMRSFLCFADLKGRNICYKFILLT